MSRHRLIAALLLLVGLTTLAYLPVAGAGFVWSDDINVTENPLLRDASGLRQIWTWGPTTAFAAPAQAAPPATAPARTIQAGPTPNYFPLTHSLFWIEYHLWHDRPLGFHLVNLFLHLTSSGLVWILLFRLGVPFAYVATLLFALHPVNVESVAWVSQLSNPLSLTLALASALCWIHGAGLGSAAPPPRRAMSLILASLLLAAALAAKPTVAPLPAVLLIIAWVKRGRVTWRDLLALSPMFILAIAAGWLAIRIESLRIDPAQHDWAMDWTARLALSACAVAFYAEKLVAPIGLSFQYDRWPAVGTAGAWLIFAAMGATLALLFLFRRRISALPLAASLCFVILLLPALALAGFYWQRYSFVADRFQYAATIPIAALAAAIAWRITRHRLGAALLTVLALLAIPLLGWLSFQHARTFHDSETLDRDALSRNPNAWMAAENLAGILLKARGRDAHPEAAGLLQSAMAVEPWQPTIARALAAIYADQGRTKDAHAVLEKNVAVNPTDGESYEQRADLLVKTLEPLIGDGVYTQAGPLYEKAFRYAPQRPSVARSLVKAYLTDGRVADARQVLETALNYHPADAGLHLALADVLTRQHQYPAANVQFDYANALTPNQPETLYRWGEMLIAADRAPQAENRLRQALQLLTVRRPAETAAAPGDPPPPQPQTARFHYQLGRALRQQGNIGEAVREFMEATRNDERFVAAYVEAGNTLLPIREESAEQFYRSALHINPDDADAQVALARLLATSSDPQRRNLLEAASLVRRAIDTTHGRDLNLLVGAGDLLVQCRFYDQAVDSYRRAFALQGAGAPSSVQCELIWQRIQSCRLATQTPLPDYGLQPSVAGEDPDLGILNEPPPYSPPLRVDLRPAGPLSLPSAGPTLSTQQGSRP